MTAADRPILVMPLFLPNFDVIHAGWLGGVVYVQMLARLLSDLEPSERPRILVLTDAELTAPTIAGLRDLAAVEGIFRPDGTPLTMAPELAAEVAPGGRPDQARIDAMLARASTLFPVSRAMFNPDTALHWIPDFQHKHLPEMFDDEELRQRDREIGIMLNSRRFALVSSQDAAADLQRFYPDARARVFVWPFISAIDVAAAPPADPRPRFGLPEKYLFAPNQFWKHKDHATLFEAVDRLVRRGFNVALVCTGNRGDARNPRHYAELQKFVVDRGLAARIVHLGVVGNDELRELFRHAAAVVQPSLFEGWSTVVEDAKAVGRPIFLSDLAVHREQSAAPNPFHFFPPGDADALAELIAAHWPRLAPGPDATAEMGAALARRARARTAARSFLAIMREIAAARP
jgi:glycosyltransferase involved in cell wall biosynthesis